MPSYFRATALLGRVSIVLLCLGGCYGGVMIDNDALDYNKHLSKYWNQQLFLNMVRASHKAPMYFTAVTQVQEGYTFTAGIGTTSTYPQRLPTSNNFSTPVTLGASGGPSMVMGTLDSDKFMRGLLHPLDLDVIKLYVDMGWPKELLLLLFVRTLELKLPTGARAQELVEKELQEKDPTLKGQNLTTKAQGIVSKVKPQLDQLRQDLGFKDGENELVFEGLLDSPDNAIPDNDSREFDQILQKEYPEYYRYYLVVRKIAKLLNGMEDELLTFKGKAELQFVSRADDVGPALDLTTIKAKPEFLALAQKDGYQIKTLRKNDPIDDPETNRYQLQATRKGVKLVFRGVSDVIPAEGLIKVRSAEAVLYHLGEMIRFCNRHNGKAIKIFGPLKEPRVPLFLARKKREGEESLATFLSVPYGDDEYVIPAEGSGESVHALSLASQLVMLYKSSDGLPTGGVYTLISR